MTKSRKRASKIEKETIKDSLQVQVVSGTYLNGTYYPVGSVVEVSQEMYNRIISEGDTQVKPI